MITVDKIGKTDEKITKVIHYYSTAAMIRGLYRTLYCCSLFDKIKGR